MFRFSFSLLFGLVAISLIQAEELAPGTKWVEHQATFRDLDKYPDFRFFSKEILITPAEKKDPPKAIALATDTVVTLGSKTVFQPIYVIAVPKSLYQEGEQPKAEWFEGKVSEVLFNGPLMGMRTTRVEDPRDVVRTVFRVEIKNNQLILYREQDESAEVQAPANKLGFEKEAEELDRVIFQYGVVGLVLLLAFAILWWLVRRPKK